MMNAQLLAGLRNGQNTDLGAGTIRNADAVLLLLNSAGGVARTRDLKDALRQWRPGLSFGYLFQFQPTYGTSGYGFLGSNFHQASTVVYHNPTYSIPDRGEGHESIRRNYYYRTARGTVAISAEGYRRLTELGVPRVQA